MPQEKIRLVPGLREELKQALILEEDLLTLARTAPREPLPVGDGSFRIRGSLPVPRMLDPETAEMRVLEVRVRPVAGGGWEIFAVVGLDSA